MTETPEPESARPPLPEAPLPLQDARAPVEAGASPADGGSDQAADPSGAEPNVAAQSGAAGSEPVADGQPSKAEAAAPAAASAPAEPAASPTLAAEVTEASADDEPAAADTKPPAASAEAPPEEAPQVELPPAALPFAAALEAKNPVEGRVIGWNKGGFHVVSEDVTTFCPKSLMELGGQPRPPAEYVNNSYTFHVLEIKEAGRRIVLTRRPAIRAERRQALDDIRSKQGTREPVTGTVTSIAEFGAFVDLGGGIRGLVHRTQLSRSRSGNPGDIVKIGQEVKALVTKVEPGKKTGKKKRLPRISLSIKALEPDPWRDTAKKFQAGDQFKGKIVRHSEFGLFVELAPGLDGLIHTSQLPVGKQMSAPELAAGEEVEGWILEVAPKRRRLALTLREVPASDPWRSLGKQYVEGAQLTGRVEQVSRFGIFVELEPGLTGLLPMSAVTLPQGNQAQRAYPPGREIKVVIQSIDRKRRRLGLAPPGSQLVGTKADYRNYRKRQQKSTGLNVMAAAFSKLRQSR